MPPLIQKWNELKDEDKDLFPLLEVKYFCPFGLRYSYFKDRNVLRICPFFLVVSVFSGHSTAEWFPALL